MALEPISSVMTYQAQSLHQTTQLPKIPAMNKEVIFQEATQPVDHTTPVVKTVEEKQADDSQNGQNSGQNQQLPNHEQIKKAVEQMNRKMMNSEVLFGIHEETNRVTIKIVDKESKEVIKELPPKKTLDMIAKAWELAGLLVDEKR